MLNTAAITPQLPPADALHTFPPARRTTTVRQNKRQGLIADGRCVNYSRCGNERGDDGTETMCRPCAAQKNAKDAPKLSRSRRLKRKRGLCIERKCNAPTYKKRRRCKDHLIMAAQSAKRRRDRDKTEAGGISGN